MSRVKASGYKKTTCTCIVVSVLCLLLCVFSSCIFMPSNDDDLDTTTSLSSTPKATDIALPTQDTQNPVYKLFIEYNRSFANVSSGLTDRLYSDLDIDTAVVNSVLELMSHNSYLTRVYASIGMLYNYNTGWSGTLTGAYGGMGELFFSNDAYSFAYTFNDGSQMEGEYSENKLICSTFDPNGTLAYSCELIALDKAWISRISFADAHSFLELNANGLSYISFVGEFSDVDRLSEGITLLSEYAEKYLVYENGELGFEYFGR